MKTKKEATFPQKHPIYRCTYCKRKTRVVDEYSNQPDAEFEGLCVTCLEEGFAENEHADWDGITEEDHPYIFACLECK